MRVAAIHLSPVKSTALRSVTSAYVGPSGLRGDREWMVVDADHRLVSAREDARLFSIVADTPATGAAADLRLSAPDLPSLELAHPTEGACEILMFNRPPLQARPAGTEADVWLRKALGRDDVHLVWCDDPSRRTLKPTLALPTDRAAFHDNSPVTLASTTSMAQLDAWMPGPLPVSRFRTNLVVEGVADAFVEDGWRTVRIGEAEFRVANPIDRCVMTTVDATTLARGSEPIRTLARHRKWDGKTWFGLHLMIEVQGTVTVGDDVLVVQDPRPPER